MTEVAVTCALWTETNDPRKQGLFTPEYVDRLARGVRRHLDPGTRIVCVTDLAQERFAEDVEVHPFAMREHVGTWMSLTEVFRPDLNVERGLFMGLDTVIVGDLRDLASYRGPVAFTRSHEVDPPLERSAVRLDDPRNTRAVCNAVVTYGREFASTLWARYSSDPIAAARAAPAFWRPGEGIASEMVYWRRYCEQPWDVLSDLFPGQIASYTVDVRCAKEVDPNLRVVYFHGALKPSNASHPLIEEHWR